MGAATGLNSVIQQQTLSNVSSTICPAGKIFLPATPFGPGYF
jgi:hypothetical protein